MYLKYQVPGKYQELPKNERSIYEVPGMHEYDGHLLLGRVLSDTATLGVRESYCMYQVQTPCLANRHA